MQCQDVVALFSDYLDDNLTDDQENLVKDHLRRCKGCEHNFKLVETTLQLLPKYPKIEVSPGFETRLWSRIRASEPNAWQKFLAFFQSPTSANPYLSPAFALATALVIIAGTGFVMRGYLQSSPPLAPQTLAESPASSSQAGVSLSDNPLAAVVSNGPKRYVMPRLSRDQFDDEQPRLLRGSGEENWTEESVNSRLVITPVRPEALPTDTSRASHATDNGGSTELRF